MAVYTGIPFDKSQHYCNYGASNVNPRGTHVLDRRDLYYKDAVSDKVYIIIVSQKAQGVPDYFVDAFYGRRGGNMQHQPKMQTGASSTASNMALKLVNEKKAKGYVDYVLGTPNTVQRANINGRPVSPYQGVHNPNWPPALNPISYGSLAASKMSITGVIEDTLWVLEEKLPGPRSLIYVADSGGPITITVEDLSGAMADTTILLNHIQSFLRMAPSSNNFVLDGFLMHRDPAKCNKADILDTLLHGNARDRFQLYFKAVDLPFYGSKELRNVEWKDRRSMMKDIFQNFKKAVMEPSWNPFDDTNNIAGIYLHRYAYFKKEEFIIGKTKLVAKHVRGHYDPASGRVQDKWLEWEVRGKRGSKQGSTGIGDSDN